MQVLKEDLREIILEKSEQEFLEKGFANASLRRIAKLSGTTIGNLYHYFESKQALFDELVGAEYTSLLYLFEDHEKMEISSDLKNNNDIYTWKTILNEYFDYFAPIFTKRFLLLMDKSNGSKYEHAREAFVNMMEKNLSGHLIASGVSVTPGFSYVISQQLISGLVYIIRNHDDIETIKKLICDTFLFYIAGVLRLAGN